jgi:putative flippase GtrA
MTLQTSTEAPSTTRTRAGSGDRKETPMVLGQAMRFAVVGTLSTGLHFLLFTAFNLWWDAPQLANITALVLSTVANTAANRAWTFGVTGREGVAKHQVQGFVLFLVTWAATAGGLAVLHHLRPGAGTLANLVALAAATAVSMVIRFFAMRLWVFREP